MGMEKQACILSVLTTCYNRENFIAECIESVLASSFKRFEYIIVDDQSTDRSVDIIRSYAERDPRIRLVINESNLGDYPNRNQAAQLASGHYIKYVDADDLIGPYTLQIMLDAMAKFPEAGVGFFDYSLENRSHVANVLSPEEVYSSHYSGERYIFGKSPLSAVIRREAFENVGRFIPTRQVGDCHMWHKLCAAYPTVIIPTLLAHYRTHDAQESSHIRANPLLPFSYYDVALSAMETHPGQIPTELLSRIKTQIQKRKARSVLTAIRKHGFRMSNRMRLSVNWSWLQVIKEAFRQGG